MPTVKIRPGANDEEIIDATTKWTRTREVGKMRRAKITVPRADANAVTLNEKEDDIELVGVDTLRLVDVETGGPTVTLVGYSYEWLANTVEPTDGGNLRTGSDADLVNEWINDTPQWTAGTVNQQATGLSFVFNHAAPHEGLRRIGKNVPGEILFRDTGTVDYIDRLGSDKTGSLTLSSANQNIEDEITITKRGRELDGTHIRVLGAHEGEAQFFANLVPSDDSVSYKNRVNYSTSRWSDGDTRDWDRYVNKDVTDQATIEEEAAELGTEITERLVEAKATTTLDLNVGDTVQVTKTDADLNRAMRVHRIKEVAEGGTVKRELLLSTRTIVRADDSEDLRDIQRFNSGFQGSSVWGTVSGGRQPVTSTENYEFDFFYPDVAFEHSAEVQVKGRAYRAYAGVTDANEPFSFDSRGTGKFASNTRINPGNSESFNIPVDPIDDWTADEEYIALIEIRLETQDPDDVTSLEKDKFEVEIRETGIFGDMFISGQEWTDFATATWERSILTHQIDPGSKIEVTITNDGANDIVMGNDKTSEVYEVSHDHDLTADVIESFDGTMFFPSNVDVLINGTSQGTSFGDGSGTFEKTTDITNELIKGAWNTIEMTSDSVGHIIGAVGIDAYRKIGGQ
jgi:hypothetical protein